MTHSEIMACCGPGVAAIDATNIAKAQLPAKIGSAVIAVRSLPPVDCPVKHHFVPGFYLREIFMPRGAVVVSKMHKTEHQFCISKGRVSVWDPFKGVSHLQAPYVGMTKPGTQRVLLIHEDCIWTTAHANPDGGTDLEAIEARIIEAQQLENIELDPEILKELQSTDAVERVPTE